MTAVATESEPVGTDWGAVTDTGSVRRLNEDSYLAEYPVFVVADGMGGHEAGERASAEAVAAVRGLLGAPTVSPRDVQERLADAEARVRAIPTRPGRSAGTTVTGVVVVEQGGEPYWLVLNVGDSRTYRLSGGRLEQVSVDHSEIQELLDAGELTVEEAAHHPLRHVVTRALGAGAELAADFWLLPIERHDRILVCSDGLTSEVADMQIAEILLAESQPGAAAQRLVDAALEAGGRDNVTVLVVDVSDLPGSDDESTTPRGEDLDDSEDTVPRAPARESGRD